MKLALAQIGLGIGDIGGAAATIVLLNFTFFACALTGAAGVCLFPDLKRYRTAIVLGGLGLLVHSGIVITWIIACPNRLLLAPVACVLIDAAAIYFGARGRLRVAHVNAAGEEAPSDPLS
jgi:hypothetical protein